MVSITLHADLTTKTYSVLSIRGLHDVDDVSFWPANTQVLLDGSKRQKISSFGRTITVDFGVISTQADRVWLVVPFSLALVKQIEYDGETVSVVLKNPDQLSSEWRGGFEGARSYVIEFLEVAMNTTAPTAWS